MNIKDIARLADVSVSTVSKILNNKADSISEETKKKVLQIAREYNYTPYSGVRKAAGQKSHLLALVCNLEEQSPAFLKAVEEEGRQRGYNLLLLGSGGQVDCELKALEAAVNSADGVVYVPAEPLNVPAEKLQACPLPLVVAKADRSALNDNYLGYDFNEAVNRALKHLQDQGHRSIGLLSAGSGGDKDRLIRRCLKRYYNEIEIPFDNKYIGASGALESLLQTGITALICETEALAAEFYSFAFERDILIPQEISVIALGERLANSFFPALTTVLLPAAQLGRSCVRRLAEQLEGSVAAATTGDLLESTLQEGGSVAPPERAGSVSAPLLVIGTLNVDVVMKVPMMPTDGETVLISNMVSLPGGKGANQAVGAAKLGAEVYLIGRIGSDPGGKLLYSALRASGVNTRGVSVDKDVETGKAYINVAENGDSYVQVFAGANNRLKKRHLEHYEALFRTAQYCLIQTELPLATVEWAIECAAKNGCKVICKPCSIPSLPERLMKKIHLLIPNEKEAIRLSAIEDDVEKQAECFLAAGAAEVIITLAEKGCYYKGSGGAVYYPAYDEPGTKVADTTGASDAFISALAVYLGEGQPLSRAIRFGMLAAGFSVRGEGVQPSLPDRDTMELRARYYTDI